MKYLHVFSALCVCIALASLVLTPEVLFAFAQTSPLPVQLA
jgi:hypothetical protein